MPTNHQNSGSDGVMWTCFLEVTAVSDRWGGGRSVVGTGRAGGVIGQRQAAMRKPRERRGATHT